jgi:CHAD domain-containing protein
MTPLEEDDGGMAAGARSNGAPPSARASATRAAEVERKYAVDQATILPALAHLSGVASTGQQATLDLAATYFDTEALDLTRHEMTLRRRTGGHDAGWHLKLGVDSQSRTELRQPLGRAVKTPPAALVATVRAVVRDVPLLPVATVRTHRLEYDLLGAAGEVLATICDDEVHAERLVGAPFIQDWREWEVELVNGDSRLFDALDAELTGAGARRVKGGSKLKAALGDGLPRADTAVARRGLKRATTTEFLASQLAEQLAAVHRQDLRIRSGETTSVHQLRIAARRLRSALTTCRPLLDVAAVDPVRAELKWLGASLAPARDAQVMHEQLRALLDEEAPELVMGPVVRRLDIHLRGMAEQGQRTAQEALGSDRYLRLLDMLDDLVGDPPVARRSGSRATTVVPRLLQRDAKRLRRAVRAIDDARDADERDVAFHEARKKAKRLRYAAQAAVPLFGTPAKRLATSAKGLQTALGDRQDSVVARHLLRDLAAQAFLNGENGFTFGRLHARVEQLGQDAEHRFAALWREVPHRGIRRRLRKRTP